MWSDLLIRFVIGGIAVSLFALVGDLFKPKSFAGLFGAAPSIALGTLWLAMTGQGGEYAGLQGRSMVAGAVALYLYCQVVAWLLLRYQLHSAVVSVGALLVWFSAAFAAWVLFLT
jgi:hypothetical protein